MGCMSSKAGLIDFATGDEAAYQDKYLEDKVLGEGEFGVVHLVFDVKAGRKSEPLASKTLKKGMTFKDNTIYSPLKPEVLRRECKILKTLGGDQYVLKLLGIYESASLIHVVTEYCAGGEMIEYVTKFYGTGGGMRTEDVSRISYQLLTAVDHCAKHGIIHRDIKPENVMFRHTGRGSDLRLIDFGSSAFDGDDNPDSAQSGTAAVGSVDDLLQHTTFAGSAFYISPEMFQRKYTCKTDVWSAGVALYVLVAGYPAENLQQAFNFLQKSKRDLRTLPNMPENMPDSFFNMLDEMLTYRQNKRAEAGAILGCEFVKFHMEHRPENNDVGDGEMGEESFVGFSLDDVAENAAAAEPIASSLSQNGTGSSRVGGDDGTRSGKTRSVLIEGSVHRHALYLEYEKFERSITTLLATVLAPPDFFRLLDKLNQKTLLVTSSAAKVAPSATSKEAGNGGDAARKEEGVEMISNEYKLQIIKIGELKVLLKEMGAEKAVSTMSNLPNAIAYDNFAYRIALLKAFGRVYQAEHSQADVDNSVRRGARFAVRVISDGGSGLKKSLSATNISHTMSLEGGGGRDKDPNSVHGGRVFEGFLKKKQKGGR